MRIFVLGVVLMAGVAGAVSAADTTPAAPLAPAAAPAPQKAKLICEEDEATGSRLQTRRTCMTAAQWQDYRLALRRDIEHNQDRGLCSQGCGVPGGGGNGKN